MKHIAVNKQVMYSVDIDKLLYNPLQTLSVIVCSYH